MKAALANFCRDQAAQDLVEYSLLLAFVVICSVALLLASQESIVGIWSVTNRNLSAAQSAAN